jgi:uncharacterized protein YndB with AHSA1/START domain
MEEQKISIEYPLQTKSPNIVWGMISNAAGLQKWIADEVTEEEDRMIFTWGQPWTERDTKTSHIIEVEKFHYIRMKWDYHESEEAYWELRIEKSEMTDHLNLIITDYCKPDDIDDIRELWNNDLERLHQVSGL